MDEFLALEKILNPFYATLQKCSHFTPDKNIQAKIIRSVYSKYFKYKIAYKISVNSFCAYKIIAWYGFSLAEFYKYKGDINKIEPIVKSTCATLLYYLKNDVDANFDNDFVKKIKNMVIAELNGNAGLGLGANGLYMTFRALSYHKNGNNLV